MSELHYESLHLDVYSLGHTYIPSYRRSLHGIENAMNTFLPGHDSSPGPMSALSPRQQSMNMDYSMLYLAFASVLIVGSNIF